MYDLVIGLETLADWKAILNFHEKTVAINYVELPMQALEDLGDSNVLNNLYREATESTVFKIATNWVTKIPDARYDKANLPEIVDNNCSHLTVIEIHKLLWLLLWHGEMFDGTLGDW